MRYTIREIKDSYERTLSEKDEKISKLEKQVENLQKQLLTEMDEKQIIFKISLDFQLNLI